MPATRAKAGGRTGRHTPDVIESSAENHPPPEPAAPNGALPHTDAAEILEQAGWELREPAVLRPGHADPGTPPGTGPARAARAANGHGAGRSPGKIAPMAFDLGGGPAATVSADQAVGPYLRAVQRHWKLVAAVCVLAVLITGITLSRASGSYSTGASVLVTPIPEGQAGFTGIGTVVDTGDPARNVQTAAALIDTPVAAARVARTLGKPWTTDSVLAATTVTPLGASNVLSVSATAPTPLEAQRIATDFARDAVAYRAQVVQGRIAASIAGLEARLVQLGKAASTSPEGAAVATSLANLRAVQGTGNEPTLSVSQDAQLPTAPNGASKALILLLALVGGFALGSVAAVALETFSRPVRDREEIQQLFPVPILAALPPITDRLHRFYGTPPWALPADVFEQLRMLRVQLSLSSLGCVIMVTSAGAGDGKTTVAAALAAAFAEADQSVIMLDLDLRKPDLRRLLEVDETRTTAPPVGPSGAPMPVPKLPGVEIFPTPRGNMAIVEMVVQRLPLLINQARRTADYVIIDTAPVGEVSEALRVATMCDQIVFVARPRHTDRRRLTLARDLLDRAGLRPVGMVLVGRETGLPKADEGYAYMTAMGATMNGGDERPERRPRVPAVKKNGTRTHEHD